MSVVSRSCPNCGAPVAPTDTLLSCAFCKAPLMVVKAPPPPPAPSPPVPALNKPVSDGGKPLAAVFVGIGVLGLGGVGVVAAIVLHESASVPPPPVPAQPTHPAPFTPTVETPNVPGVSGAGIVAMMDVQCTQGDSSSCVAAGMLYEHGQAGVPVDLAKARAYYEKGCALGHSGACSMRGVTKRR